MFGWLKALFRRRPKQPLNSKAAHPIDAEYYYGWPVRGIHRYDGPSDPPPMHWKPCHPSTMRRFKAEMTCSAGHSLVLRSHQIAEDGRVQPSVVCTVPGCSFHEFVRLQTWEFGDL